MPAVLRPDIQTFAEITAIDQMVTRAMERALPAGLGRAQFNLLTYLAYEGELGPGQLAERLMLTRGAVTYLLDALQAKGLVSVRPAKDDSRRKQVRLTESGGRMLNEAGARLKTLSENLRAALPASEFERTLPLLKALRSHLAQHLIQD